MRLPIGLVRESNETNSMGFQLNIIIHLTVMIVFTCSLVTGDVYDFVRYLRLNSAISYCITKHQVNIKAKIYEQNKF